MQRECLDVGVEGFSFIFFFPKGINICYPFVYLFIYLFISSKVQLNFAPWEIGDSSAYVAFKNLLLYMFIKA